MTSKGAFFHDAMWQDPDDEFLCKKCLAHRLMEDAGEGIDHSEDEEDIVEGCTEDCWCKREIDLDDWCCLHDYWDEYVERMREQASFWG